MIVGFVVCVGTGILLLVLGWLIWKKQMIHLIHDYHYRKVKEADVPAYTRQMGIALIWMGVGSLLTGIINLAFQTGAGWILFVIGFVVGSVLMFKAQMKYNGSIFS